MTKLDIYSTKYDSFIGYELSKYSEKLYLCSTYTINYKKECELIFRDTRNTIIKFDTFSKLKLGDTLHSHTKTTLERIFC